MIHGVSSSTAVDQVARSRPPADQQDQVRERAVAAAAANTKRKQVNAYRAGASNARGPAGVGGASGPSAVEVGRTSLSVQRRQAVVNAAENGPPESVDEVRAAATERQANARQAAAVNQTRRLASTFQNTVSNSNSGASSGGSSSASGPSASQVFGASLSVQRRLAVADGPPENADAAREASAVRQDNAREAAVLTARINQTKKLIDTFQNSASTAQDNDPLGSGPGIDVLA